MSKNRCNFVPLLQFYLPIAFRLCYNLLCTFGTTSPCFHYNAIFSHCQFYMLRNIRILL